MFGLPPAIDPSIVRDVVARGVLIQSERGVLIKSECPVLIAPEWGVLIGSEWGVLEKSDYPVLITPEYSSDEHEGHFFIQIPPNILLKYNIIYKYNLNLYSMQPLILLVSNLLAERNQIEYWPRCIWIIPFMLTLMSGLFFSYRPSAGIGQ